MLSFLSRVVKFYIISTLTNRIQVGDPRNVNHNTPHGQVAVCSYFLIEKSNTNDHEIIG